jgi:adenylate kinase family enzyme
MKAASERGDVGHSALQKWGGGSTSSVRARGSADRLPGTICGGTRRRLCVIASASGNGKRTLARCAAARLGVVFVELDALVHGPGWAETSSESLPTQLSPVLAEDGWVIDGAYTHKLGDLVVRAADQIVWLDPPIRIWLPRLIRRTARRLLTCEEL